MLLSLAWFCQVLTVLLWRVAPYTVTNPTEISGTELHAVMHNMRLVLHLVLNSSRSGMATCPQSHEAQIGSCEQNLWLILRAHQPHPLFCITWPLAFSGLMQSTYGPSTRLSSGMFCCGFLFNSNSLK